MRNPLFSSQSRTFWLNRFIQVVILSYPSLAVISEPFKIASGILYALDFSDNTVCAPLVLLFSIKIFPKIPHNQLLIVTSTALYFVPLPLNILAVKNDREATHSLALPTLEATTTLPVPGLDVLSASEDGGVRTFRAGRFNPINPNILYTVINSTPPSGRGSRGKKVERRAFLVRWELAAGDKKEQKEESQTWVVRKVRNIGKRAVTVFTVRCVSLV